MKKMRKYFRKFFICMLLLMVVVMPITVEAEEITSTDFDAKDLVEEENDSYMEMDCEYLQISNIHENVLSNQAAYLNGEGFLELKDEASLYYGENTNYLSFIQDLNCIVELGIGYYDDDLLLQFYDDSEIVDIVYNDKNTVSSDNVFGDNQENMSKLYLDAGTPRLAAYTIATNNRNTLIKFYNTALAGNPSNPAGASGATIGYFIAKVKPYGDWDYKHVPGYADHRKTWIASTRYGQYLKTTEWFGNYNYGFTGSVLFSEKILLTGGDIVSLITSGAPDNYSDKSAIKQGYNESL